MQKKLISKRKFVLVTNEFGSEIFIAPLVNLQISITDEINQAEIWSEYDLNKLIFFKKITGYKNLKFIEVE